MDLTGKRKARLWSWDPGAKRDLPTTSSHSEKAPSLRGSSGTCVWLLVAPGVEWGCMCGVCVSVYSPLVPLKDKLRHIKGFRDLSEQKSI